MSVKWIRIWGGGVVKDRLPEVDQEVLVYLKMGNRHRIGYWDGKIWHYMDGSGWEITELQVSWWAELPRCP